MSTLRLDIAMKALPNTAENLALAKRLIWFEAPAQRALDDFPSQPVHS
jgi:hypothetical protein